MPITRTYCVHDDYRGDGVRATRTFHTHHRFAADLRERLARTVVVPWKELDVGAHDFDDGAPAQHGQGNLEAVLEVVKDGVDDLDVTIGGHVLCIEFDSDEAEGIHHVAALE